MEYITFNPPTALKKSKPSNITLNYKEQESFTTAFLKSKKPSRLAYQKLVEAKCNHKILYSGARFSKKPAI